MVRELGFIVLVEQLLQHSRGPRQYLMVMGWFVRGHNLVERVLVQTWQVFVVRFLSMVREAFGLSRCLVMHTVSDCHNRHFWGLCLKMRHKNKYNRFIKYSLTGIDGQNMQTRWSFATYLATETTDNQ